MMGCKRLIDNTMSVVVNTPDCINLCITVISIRLTFKYPNYLPCFDLNIDNTLNVN